KPLPQPLSECFNSEVLNVEWIADPGAWLGLLTLIVLEIVLGIDNLIFIAILANKLPPHQRDKARVLGLSLALVMRLLLLLGISWLVTLTEPLFSLFDNSLAGRVLILLSCGVFVLLKPTVEVRGRIVGMLLVQRQCQSLAAFWAVVA